MPIDYQRDDARKRILAVSRGEVTFDDARQVIDRQVADGAWSYAVLYDTRAGVGVPTTDDLRRLALHIGVLTTKHGPRGPIALVVSNRALLQKGRQYARLGELTALSVEVFLTIEDAERWLAQHGSASL